MIQGYNGVDTHKDRNACGLCGKYFKEELEFILSANIWACRECFYNLTNQDETNL